MLENLPNELILQILAHCSSARDLHRFLTASPCCYRIFALSPETMLLSLLRGLVPASAWGDFAAVCHAGAFTCDDTDNEQPVLQKQDVPAFLDRYFNGGFGFPTTKAHLVAGLRLHATTTYFINDCVDKAAEEISFLAEHNLYGALGSTFCSVRARQAEVSDGISQCTSRSSSDTTDAAMFETLSSTETARLYCAFYRLEMQSRVFRHGQRSFSMLSGREQLDLFLRRLPPWAVEELTCAHQYFLYGVWDALKESINCGLASAESPLRHFGTDLPFVPSCLQSNRAWPLFLSGLVLRGVDFLYNVLVVQQNDRRFGRRLPEDSLDTTSSGELEAGNMVPQFLVSALEIARCRQHAEEEPMRPAPEEDGEDGEEKDAAGPSRGFCEHACRAGVIAGGYLPMLRYEEHEALRATGYVFWDRGKMRSDVMRNAVAGANGMDREAYYDRYGREHRSLVVAPN
ncbi:hypothetical protein LMH87_009974 [Akanthomyces muscarius]|uniref:F-box domain-containing protein n=1 Tax=Akanthomyces muscarius TaxID=2231603 RepID=A0A9W8UK22_AKAMU|nr:hypothetical protein LMH87_009974 [Akanthomyces muscarius]KAJ4153489.1 hypothetical protein LMH87_009974 [Akanthomyces muscarius]